jgi:hypothetical protein
MSADLAALHIESVNSTTYLCLNGAGQRCQYFDVLNSSGIWECSNKHPTCQSQCSLHFRRYEDWAMLLNGLNSLFSRPLIQTPVLPLGTGGGEFWLSKFIANTDVLLTCSVLAIHSNCLTTRFDDLVRMPRTAWLD